MASPRPPTQSLTAQPGRPSTSPFTSGVPPSPVTRLPASSTGGLINARAVPSTPTPALTRPSPVSSTTAPAMWTVPSHQPLIIQPFVSRALSTTSLASNARPPSLPTHNAPAPRPRPKGTHGDPIASLQRTTPTPVVAARQPPPPSSGPTATEDQKQPPSMHGRASSVMTTHNAPPSRRVATVEEQKQPHQQSTFAARITTVLRPAEIAELQQYHDNSLAANSKKAYQSDYDSFVAFLRDRFPRLPIERLQQQCTVEHVLSYLNHLCNEGKKITTINRRYATIRKHIVPALFSRALVSGSREEETMREVERIVRGMRRTVGAEHRIRGKKPLLIEHIREMVDRAAEATDDDGNAMSNKRCRDVSLLLFMFFSAMRRSEIAALLWSDLTFDRRGVVVLIRKSKTDQECKSQPIALPRLEHEYCAVAALEKWKAKSGGEGDSPVFRWISKKDEVQWRVLIDQRIVALIKRYCELIGLDSASFAAHSTRSGYVTSSSERGVSISELMKRTRHKAVSSLQVYMKSADLFQGAGDRRL